jgi:peptidoglycan/LPS O-acetylase OafA/YrhL
MSYRADIDGLRAVAVLSVLAFHYGAPLPGGFIGVDVFFVISGFLITQILQAEIQAGVFSALGFYDRRMRRILPALLVMLVAVLFAGRVLSLPGDYRAIAASSAAASFAVSNFYFLGNTGYFDQAADLMPLLHTWSLAVEEQFYVAWPLLLFAIAADRTRRIIVVLVSALVLIGLTVSIVWFKVDAKAAFFMALPRAWELALGALLVYLPPLPRSLSETSTTLGLALIALGFWKITPQAFPGPAALLPCVGAALVIWPGERKTIVSYWLSLLAPVGLISYSLYLWHWPVWVFFRIYINNEQPRISEAIALAVTSIVLAALSWLFVERPFRKMRWPASRTIGAGLGASTLLFCTSAYVDSADGLPRRLPSDYVAMRSLDVMWEWPCAALDLVKSSPLPTCSFGAPWKPGVRKAMLWGDSNAEMLAPIVEVGASAAGVSVASVKYCPAVLDGDATRRRSEPNAGYNAQCHKIYREVFEALASEHDIQTVILAGSWNYLLPALDGEDRASVFRTALDNTVRRLLALNKRIVIITSIPQWSGDPIPCALLASALPRRPCNEQQLHLPHGGYDVSKGAAGAALRAVVAAHPQVLLIDPVDSLCNGTDCLTRLNDEFLYRDGVHFRRNLSLATNQALAARLGFDRLFAE